eukprot:TRINITY_DN31160_c0_g2_i1.p1 TRINITY_DN31160_c0_g2~~TRINITY_DN31160_c0_g2_i1.p1  ORF type:complete len:671 (+),score=172.06 TRINITY_DN31160_c0_g2_i1:53-2014(+)
MEVQVEAAPAWQVPPGCCVSVRVGESLKQRKLDSKVPAKYQFDGLDSWKRAKIGVYQLVGTCTVPLDPSGKTSEEVTLASSDPKQGSIKLRVSAGPTDVKAAEVSKQQRVDDTEAAYGYLSHHKVEQRLGDAVRALLRMKPEDPFDFLCRQLKADSPLQQASATKTQVLPPQAGKNDFKQSAKILPQGVVPVKVPSAAAAAAAAVPKVGRAPQVAPEPPVLSGDRYQPVGSFQLEGLRGVCGADERLEVERVLSKALLELEGDFMGEYFPLPASTSWAGRPGSLQPAEISQLMSKGILFKAAQPNGRGVFVAESEELALWINESAHLQLLVKPGKLQDSVAGLIDRLTSALDGLLSQDGYALLQQPLPLRPQAALQLQGLSGFSSLDGRLQAERVLSKALLDLEGDFAGEYFPAPGSTSWGGRPGGLLAEEAKDLTSKGLLFDAAEPKGRGVFVADSKELALWINEAAHVQLLVKPGTSQHEVSSLVDRLTTALDGALCHDGYSLLQLPPILQPQAAFQLQGLRPSTCMSNAEAQEAERVLSRAFAELEGDLEGEYFPLPGSSSCPLRPGGASPEESDCLLQKGLLFSAPEPAGRGIFVSRDQELAVWINEARAHIQVLLKPSLSLDEVGKQVERLVQALHGSVQESGYALIA